MEDIVIEGTDVSPYICGYSSGKIEIKGKSMMADALSFYLPIHKWVNELMHSSVAFLDIFIDLTYFNSSSSKQLLKLLMLIDGSDKKCKVTWLYPLENDLLEERGKEFEVMLDLEFEYIEKKNLDPVLPNV